MGRGAGGRWRARGTELGGGMAGGAVGGGHEAATLGVEFEDGCAVGMARASHWPPSESDLDRQPKI